MRPSQYTQNIEANKQRFEMDDDLYKQRQAIVEHPYGTIKRQWGLNYIITKKGKNKASADFGLMLTAYNLRRIINLIGLEVLLNHLKCIDLYPFTEISKINFVSAILRSSLTRLNPHREIRIAA